MPDRTAGTTVCETTPVLHGYKSHRRGAALEHFSQQSKEVTATLAHDYTALLGAS